MQPTIDTRKKRACESHHFRRSMDKLISRAAIATLYRSGIPLCLDVFRQQWPYPTFATTRTLVEAGYGAHGYRLLWTTGTLKIFENAVRQVRYKTAFQTAGVIKRTISSVWNTFPLSNRRSISCFSPVSVEFLVITMLIIILQEAFYFVLLFLFSRKNSFYRFRKILIGGSSCLFHSSTALFLLAEKTSRTKLDLKILPLFLVAIHYLKRIKRVLSR